MGFLRSSSDSADGRRPGARERGRMRRRLRRQRQMREALLLDLGALVFELNRHGRREPELLQAKAAELTAVDEEVRALAEALGNEQTLTQLVATGVAGSCENCGSLMSVDARYCSSCGAPAVPALSGDEPRRAFRADQRMDAGALATGVQPEQDYAPPEWAETAEQYAPAEAPPEQAAPERPAEEQAPPEPASEEALAHEAAAEEAAWHEAADEDVPVEEPEAEEALAEEPGDEPGEAPPEETAKQEGVHEGVIRVTRVPPTEEEPEPVEEPSEPEAEEEPEPLEDQPEPEAEAPTPTDRTSHDGQRTGKGVPGQAPRALADDALDTAAKAIRTGIARGREWIRGRRTD